MINQKRLTENFVKMVGINSESGNEHDIQVYLMEYLNNLGFDVFADNAGAVFGSNGNNVIAKKAGHGEPIILSAHMDTVSPGNDIEVLIDGDVISSKGDTILGGDDKGGIAVILETIETILENDDKHPPLEIVFTISEEGGLKGMKNLDFSKIESKRALVFDTGGDIGKIVTSAPGQDQIDITIHGKPAHAGLEPEKGINALIVAAHAITKAKLLRIDEETTCNLGIVSGGSATNIVMSELIIKAEARSLDLDKLAAQTKHIVDVFTSTAKEFGTTADIDVVRAYNPFKIDENSPFLQKYLKVTEECGFKPLTMAIGGGSDANVLNAKGIETLNVSVNMCKVHTTEEYIRISDMCNAAKILREFLISEGV